MRVTSHDVQRDTHQAFGTIPVVGLLGVSTSGPLVARFDDFGSVETCEICVPTFPTLLTVLS